MKRRIAAMLLAVTTCLVGVYQTGLYPASGQSPTPSSSPGPLGSISGRVYVDVDANGSFGGPMFHSGFPFSSSASMEGHRNPHSLVRTQPTMGHINSLI